MDKIQKRGNLSYYVSSTALATVSLVTIFALAWFGIYGFETPSFNPCLVVAKAKVKNAPLAAVGDIMLSRVVEQKMIKYNDWTYPFLETYNLTSSGDIIFGNLESPIIAGPIVETGSMVFRTDPQSVAGLTLGGFNVLSLANNHMKNQGSDGISKTMEHLDLADIKHSGAGLNDTEAEAAAIIEVNSLTFGFLSYVDGSFTPDSYEATADRSGSPFLHQDLMTSQIEELKNEVDVVIVSMHAGSEYTLQPSAKQISFARAAIDAGAELVIGHHPHVVQPYEEYNGGLILYSLGNFVFDQMWSEETREGAIATIEFKEKEMESFELTPVRIYDYCQPKILSDEEGGYIIERMSNFTF